MVLNEIKEKVSGNLSQTKAFSIEANEAAFQILSDKLYKYPIRAIVRENASNAIDALRAIGKPLNDWELTIPNSINPMFAIEDHGVGMDDDEINEIYTTFFKSTKSSSNDQTGMFGLGSKTPFSYTKQFIVESSKNGFKNIYSMHSENGAPEVSKVNPQPIPTDKTGTKISFAVKQEDFIEFYDAIIHSSAVWPGLPKLNGAEEFYSYIKRKMWQSEISAEKIFENTNKIYSSVTKLPSDKDFSYMKFGNEKFYLEMGNVLYYVSLEQLSDLSPTFKCKENTYLIHAPIGAVSITPNREDLQYDEKTKTFLLKEIKSAIINNYEFTFDSYADSDFKVILGTQESEINEVAKKSLKKLSKEYKALAKKINIFEKEFSKGNIFVVDSYKLNNNSKHLLSAWKELDGFFDAERAGYKFLKRLSEKNTVNFDMKLFELSEGEYKRYKLTDGHLTGFFNTRLNRINRDLFAELNGRKKSITSAVTKYGAESLQTPMFIFCKPGESERIKGLDDSIKCLEVIKEFSKLPNSFDYYKDNTEEKAEEKIETKKCLEIYFNGDYKVTSLDELKTDYKNYKFILMTKPNRDYELIDFGKYFNEKIALGSMQTYRIEKWDIDNLLKEYNAKFNKNLGIIVGKPSDFKKMKIYNCKELSFEKFSDINSFIGFKREIATEIAEHYVKELETFPKEIEYQTVINEEILLKMQNGLNPNSKFLNKVTEIYKKGTNENEVTRRKELILKAQHHRNLIEESVQERINAYSSAKSVNRNEDIINMIKEFPLGSVFLKQHYISYYQNANDCWKYNPDWNELFKVINLVEGN